MKNPFPPYIPEQAEVLILGSFPPVSLVEEAASGPKDLPFFYGSSRNQLWVIMERVFQIPLKIIKDGRSLDKDASLKNIHGLLREERIAVADIIRRCHRSRRDSDDYHIIIDEYLELDRVLLKHSSLKTILFTSIFVEKQVKKIFSGIFRQYSCFRLPSPSPRARGSVAEKAEKYGFYLKKR